MLRDVHLPLLKGGIFTAGIMVFVEILKEMPMTLMTRPFGRDTLAVKIFEFTSEGEWERDALPALVLLLALALRIARRYGPGWATRLHEAERAHAESERTYFRRFRAATRAGDPRATANALMAWLDHADSTPGPATCERFAAGAGDP